LGPSVFKISPFSQSADGGPLLIHLMRSGAEATSGRLQRRL
jgi:hypothetical protein